VGRLVVIEGLDGAGKRTFAGRLTTALRAAGATVSSAAFPRYDDDVHAELARDALYGRMGDLATSVHAMAVLFALDRRAAAAGLRASLAAHDVVLVDRYVASNAAYNAARLGQDASGEVVGWVRELEIDRFGIPVPDHQLLLAPPRAVAAERARSREASEDRRRDAYESDEALQARTDAVYRRLADTAWLSPWTVLAEAGTGAPVGPGHAPTADPADPAGLVAALLHRP
jgi:dTMP kinase